MHFIVSNERINKTLIFVADSKKQGGGMAPGGNGPNQGMSDPIGALQTLARQGTGNNQMMGIPNPAANPQGMVPQPNTNAATNRKLFNFLALEWWKDHFTGSN